MYDKITSIITKTIALISPSTARDYVKNHQILRAYEAAKTNGINRKFSARQTSGAQEIQESWQTVTDRVRQLVRDNSHVAGMVRRFTAGLIGEGSWHVKNIKNKNSGNFDFNVKLNSEILARWEPWALSACAMATACTSYSGYVRQLSSSMAEFLFAECQKASST